MTLNQLAAVNNSSFNFIRQAMKDYDLPSGTSDSQVKSVVNSDYGGGWNQYCFDCLGV